MRARTIGSVRIGRAALAAAMAAWSLQSAPSPAQPSAPASAPPAAAGSEEAPKPDIRALTASEQERVDKLWRSLNFYAQAGGHANSLGEVFPELLPLLDQTYGPAHPATLRVRLFKAGALSQTLEHEAADRLFDEVITALKRRLGPAHGVVLSALVDRAANYIDWGRPAQAEAILPPILPLVERLDGKASAGAARVLANLAFLRHAQGRYGEAEQLARQALAIRERELESGHPLLASTRARLASALVGQGKYAEGEALLAAALPGEAPADLGGARLLEARGDLRFAQARFIDAERDFTRAAELLSRHAGHSAPESHIVSAKARIAMRRLRELPGGSYIIGANMAQLPAVKCDNAPRHLAEWWAMRLEAAVAHGAAAATTCRRAVLDFAERNFGSQHPETAGVMQELAEQLLRAGNTQEADRLARRALAVQIATQGENHPRTAGALALLSEVVAALGNDDEAEGLALRAGGNSEAGAAQLRQLIGQAQRAEASGRFDEAEALWVEADGNSQAAAQNLSLVTETLTGFIFNKMMLGRCAELKHAEIAAAAQTMRNLNQWNYAVTGQAPLEEALAISEACQGKWDAAAKRYAEIARSEVGRLGRAWFFSRDTALLEARRALTLSRNRSTLEAADEAARAAANIAIQRRYAMEFDGNKVGGALQLPGKAGSDPLAAAFVAQLRTQWARVERDAGGTAPLHIVPPSLSEQIISGKPERETTLAEASVLGAGWTAFEAAQNLGISAAAQSLLQAAARTKVANPQVAELIRRQQALADSLAQRERDLFAAFGQIQPAQLQELDRAKAELEGVGREIQRLDPRYAELVRPGSLPPADVGARLKPGEALIFVQPAWNDVYVFAMSRERFQWHKSSLDAAALDEMVRQLRCQLDGASCQPGEDANAAFDLVLAHELYREVVKPVEGALQGSRNLFVVAAGGLGGLPLGLLPTAPVRARGLEGMRQAEWLADRYAMTTLPSVSSLRAFGEAARPDYQVELTGYGNPVLGPPQEPAPARATRRTGTRFADVAAIKAMASLPGTERELLALAAGLGVPRDALRLGARATESAVKQDPLLGRSRVVVFATHGVLPGGQAGFQEPGLIFTPPGSPSAQDDGLLTASEAASLALPADWLILSACNTAASDGRPGGEALSGLARSFLYAGARSLLASHWQVSDDATAALTVEALRVARARPQLSRAQAMQEAMRAVRTGKTAEGTALAGWKPEWADPWYWAPFVLIESGS